MFMQINYVLEQEIAALSTGGGGRACPKIDPYRNVQNEARIKATFDLIVLALEWKLANVVSYQFGVGQDNEKIVLSQIRVSMVLLSPTKHKQNTVVFVNTNGSRLLIS